MKKLRLGSKLDSPVEALSLNNVILFCPGSYDCYGIKVEDWEQIVERSNNKFIVPGFTDEDEKMIMDAIIEFANITKSKLSIAEQKIMEYKSSIKYNQKYEKMVINMLDNISKRLSYEWSTKDGCC